MQPSTPELRKKWRQYWIDSDKRFEKWRNPGVTPEMTKPTQGRLSH